MGKELFTTIPSKVKNLVDDVRIGKIGLPDLQRPFVCDLRDDIGVTDALDLLYETYVKAVHYIRDCNYIDDYQKEMLMQNIIWKKQWKG